MTNLSSPLMQKVAAIVKRSADEVAAPVPESDVAAGETRTKIVGRERSTNKFLIHNLLGKKNKGRIRKPLEKTAYPWMPLAAGGLAGGAIGALMPGRKKEGPSQRLIRALLGAGAGMGAGALFNAYGPGNSPPVAPPAPAKPEQTPVTPQPAAQQPETAATPTSASSPVTPQPAPPAPITQRSEASPWDPRNPAFWGGNKTLYKGDKVPTQNPYKPEFWVKDKVLHPNDPGIQSPVDDLNILTPAELAKAYPQGFTRAQTDFATQERLAMMRALSDNRVDARAFDPQSQNYYNAVSRLHSMGANAGRDPGPFSPVAQRAIKDDGGAISWAEYASRKLPIATYAKNKIAPLLYDKPDLDAYNAISDVQSARTARNHPYADLTADMVGAGADPVPIMGGMAGARALPAILGRTVARSSWMRPVARGAGALMGWYGTDPEVMRSGKDFISNVGDKAVDKLGTKLGGGLLAAAVPGRLKPVAKFVGSSLGRVATNPSLVTTAYGQ